MTLQTVHIANVARSRKRFGVQIVRGEMITAPHNNAFQVPTITRHAMEGFDATHYRKRGQQRVFAVYNELAPRAIDGQRFYRATIPRQAPILDQPPCFQFRERLAIRGAIQRHRQLKFVGTHTQISTGQRHAFGVARKLEIRRRWAQCFKLDVAITQDVHAPTLHSAMHTPSHLQNFVRTQVHAREHVAPLVDHVRETRIVNDDRVKAWNVERTLPRGRHRQKIRFRNRAFQKRANHANRFAAVIMRGRNARITRAHPFGRFFHRRARGHEQCNATF